MICPVCKGSGRGRVKRGQFHLKTACPQCHGAGECDRYETVEEGTYLCQKVVQAPEYPVRCNACHSRNLIDCQIVKIPALQCADCGVIYVKGEPLNG